MGRGLPGDRAPLALFSPLIDAFASAEELVHNALAQVSSLGWSVLPGAHSSETLARWDANRSARLGALESIARERALVTNAYNASVMEGWSKCVLDSPSTYSSPLALTQLPDDSLSRWKVAARNQAFDIHCVLGGSPVTFGIEIEFVGDLVAVARALYEVGLATSPEVSDSNRPVGWTVKIDETVKPAGGEVVSPILVDVPSSWKDLDRVCAILRDCGVYINPSCGLHVHLGADRLGEEVSHYLRLFLLTRAFEDLIYRLAAAGGDRRHRGLDFDRPVGSRSYRAFVRSVGEFRRQLQASPFDALNFSNVGTSKHTIEFRYGNGTLDATQIQTLVILYTGLLEASRRTDVSYQDLQAAPVGSHATAGDEALVLKLCDLLFPANNRAKLAVLWLYERSQWQAFLPEIAGEVKAKRNHLLPPVLRSLAVA